MSQDETRGLNKNLDFMRAISIIFLVMNVYYFCYPYFLSMNLNIGMVDKILLNFQRDTGLFSHSLVSKSFSLLFLFFSLMGAKGRKDIEMSWRSIGCYFIAGLLLFFGSEFLLTARFPVTLITLLYTATVAAGYVCLLTSGVWISRLLKNRFMEDVFNDENESFMQETRLIANEYSVNLPTRFHYQRKTYSGWINVINPFRASLVLGTPGSGKSYAIINNYIRQQIEKGFAAYIYDFKYPDLSVIAYNQLLKNRDKYARPVGFYVINFDDPRHSHRCNPLNPAFLSDIADAYESAYVIMLNLNKSWIQKQGDFFVESPIILLAALIWYLKIYENGRYCTFPHAIELLNKPYSDLFTILTSYRELENYLSPFMDAWKGGAMEQLQVRP